MPKPTFFNLPAEKRRALMDLAIDEFSTQAYDQASISRIVARAGIAKGSFYQYFEHKLDLYKWLMDEAGKRKLEYIGSSLPDDSKDFFSWLEHLCLAGIRFAKENPRLARLGLSIMDPSSSPELRDLHIDCRRVSHEYFCAHIDSAKEAGVIRKAVNTSLAAHLLNHLLGAGLLDMLMDRLNTDLPGLLSQTTGMYLLSEDDLQPIVRDAVDILRHGIGESVS